VYRGARHASPLQYFYKTCSDYSKRPVMSKRASTLNVDSNKLEG
jgi:hypothetical protein